MLVLVLFAALIGPYFINWTSYRQDFEREASRILGQKVEVLGSATARLLPFPSVTFDNVRVVNAKTGAPMMSVAHFSMDAELAPFLRGEILIFDMRLDRPDATVRLLKDGRVDWALRNANDLGNSSVVLERVEVHHASIDFVDEQHARTEHVTGVNATLSAQDLSGPWNVEGTGAVNGMTGAFSLNTGELKPDGSLHVRTRLLPDKQPVSIEMEGDARFLDKRPRYEGAFTLQILDLAAISGQPRAVQKDPKAQQSVARATGNFALDTARLRVDQYRLEVGSTSDPYVATGEATVDLGSAPQFTVVADGQQIDLDALEEDKASAPPPPGGKTSKPKRLTPSERLQTLVRIGDLIPIPPMKGKATINLPAIVAGDTTISNVAVNAEPDGEGWKVDSFAAQFPGRTKVEAKGALKLGDDFGFTGNLLVASSQPSGLSEWLRGSVDRRIRLLDGAGFSANVHLSRNLQRFDDLELAIGRATARGSFERVAPPTGRGKVSVALNGDSLDLDTVRALVGLFIDDKSVVSLAADDVAARLKANRLSAFGADARDVDADMTYRDGDLDVKKFEVGSVAGARLSLSGKVADVRGAPTGSLYGSIDAKQAGGAFRLVHSLVGKSPVLATLEANAGLFSDTHLDVRASLNGKAKRALQATATGHSGGSELTLQVMRDDAFAPVARSPITIELTAQNASVNRLLGQMGLQPLPIDAPGPALLSTRFSGSPADGGEVGFDFSTADSEFSADGKLGLPEAGGVTGTLDTRLKSQDLTPYLIMNGIGLPDTASGIEADLRAKAKIDNSGLHLDDLGGSLGSNTLHGALTLAGTGAPAVSGTLSLATLSSGWLARLMLGPGIVDSKTGAWSTDDFAPPQDFGTDLDVAVKADRADLGAGPPATGFSGHLALKDGRLTLDAVKASWLGGQLGGALHIGNTNGTGVLSSQISLKGADISSALAGSSLKASGALDLSASVDGSGKSARALASALTGSGAATTKNIRISDLNADGFKSILKAADGKGFKVTTKAVQRLARAALSNGAFDGGSVSQAFTIAGGELRAQNLALHDPHADLTGDIGLDLAQSELTAGLSLTYQAGDDAVTGAAPAIGLDFSGPLSHPRRTLSVADLSNYLSLRAFEIQRREVELVQAGVLEKQRLRREMELLRAEADQRKQQAAIDLEEKRRRAAAQVVLAKERAAEAEAARKAAADEAARKAAEAEAAQKAAAEDAARKAAADGAARKAAAEEAARKAAEAARRKADDEARRKSQDAATPSGSSTDPSGATPPGAPSAPTGSSSPGAAGSGQTKAPANDNAEPKLNFKDLPGVTVPNLGN